MGIWEELHAVADKLSMRDERPACELCGRGRLRLIDEKPDENFGALGVTTQTLQCTACGKVTVA